MRTLIFRLSFLFISMLVIGCSPRYISSIYQVRISTDSPVRSGPGPEYSVIGNVKAGTEGTLIESRNDWHKIQFRDGNSGWIFKGITRSIGPEKVVARNDAIIRNGPGEQYKVFAIARKGKALDLLEERNDWYHVNLTDGKKGWISKNDADKLASQRTTTSSIQSLSSATTVSVKERTFLRRGPSVQYGILVDVEPGTQLTQLNERSGWFEVRTSSGATGWIHRDFITSSGVGGVTSLAQPVYVVTNTDANIRQGYGTNWDRIAQLKKGTLLVVIGQKDDWLRIRMPDQKIGWIRNDLVEFNPTILVTLDRCNIRMGPGTNFMIKATVEKGTPLVKISEQQGWSQVYLPDGETGWIRNDLHSDTNVTLFAKEECNVRDGPGINFRQIDRIPMGTPVIQLGKQDNWFNVRLQSGREGWIREDLLRETASQLVTNERANIRMGPGMIYQVIVEVPKNTPLEKLDEQDDWIKVRLPDGKTGWIRNDLASFSYFTLGSDAQSYDTSPATFSMPQTTAPTELRMRTTSSVQLRMGPSTNETIIKTLPSGTTVIRINQQGEWHEVRTVEGVRGYVHQSGFGSVSGVVVTNTRSNIRSGPNTSYAIIATVPEKTTLTRIEQRDDWINVRLSDNRKGWIQQDLVVQSASTAPPPLPVSEPATGTLITTSASKIYGGPGTNYQVVKSVNINTELRRIGKHKDWSQVELFTGEKGWIANNEVREKIHKKIIAIRRAEIHEQPNSQSTLVGMLEVADYHTPLSQEGGWYRISYKPGFTGWVSKQDVYDMKYPPVYVNTATAEVLRLPDKKANRIAIIKEGVELNPIDETDDWLFIELPRGDKGWIPKRLVDRQRHPRILITRNTEAYEQPTAGSLLKATLTKDDQFLALDKKGNWYKILLRGSDVGWVYGAYSQEITKGMLLIKDDSFLRMGPGLEYRRITTVPRGEQVKWLTEKSGWSQVQIKSGEIGWVKLELARDVTLPEMVANQNATVRAGPGNSYAQVGSVQQGKKYAPIKKEGAWYQIRLPTGTEGWVAMEVFTTKKSRLVFTLDKADIRQGPGSHYALVAQVEPAIDVNILGTEGDWYHVQLQDGKKGYIRKELIFEE